MPPEQLPNAQPQDKTPPEAKPTVEQQDPPAPRSYSQEEMDRITAKVRKNAARDAELKFRREQAAPRQEDPPADHQPPPPKEDQEPKRDDFDTHEDYQRALTRFDANKATGERLAKEKQADREKAAREQNEKAASTWKGKIVQAQEKHPDFEIVLEENDAVLDVIGAAPMRGFITESDIGPQIIYDLCKTPAEAKRIAALPAYKQAAEIAKIEEKLIAAAAPKPKEGEEDEEPGDDADPDKGRERNTDGTFKTPPKKKDPPEPIEPGSGRPANSSALPSDKDDPETWRRKELARVRKREGK